MLSFILALLVQTPTVSATDYARAENLMGYNVNPLVMHSGVRPNWLADDRFWYRTTTEKGPEVFLIDAARGTRSTFTPPSAQRNPSNAVLSPDGKRAVIHPRLQPLGSRTAEWTGNPAHKGRRKRFRICDGQCGLDSQ